MKCSARLQVCRDRLVMCVWSIQAIPTYNAAQELSKIIIFNLALYARYFSTVSTYSTLHVVGGALWSMPIRRGGQSFAAGKQTTFGICLGELARFNTSGCLAISA